MEYVRPIDKDTIPKEKLKNYVPVLTLMRVFEWGVIGFCILALINGYLFSSKNMSFYVFISIFVLLVVLDFEIFGGKLLLRYKYITLGLMMIITVMWYFLDKSHGLRETFIITTSIVFFWSMPKSFYQKRMDKERLRQQMLPKKYLYQTVIGLGVMCIVLIFFIFI